MWKQAATVLVVFPPLWFFIRRSPPSFPPGLHMQDTGPPQLGNLLFKSVGGPRLPGTPPLHFSPLRQGPSCPRPLKLFPSLPRATPDSVPSRVRTRSGRRQEPSAFRNAPPLTAPSGANPPSLFKCTVRSLPLLLGTLCHCFERHPGANMALSSEVLFLSSYPPHLSRSLAESSAACAQKPYPRKTLLISGPCLFLRPSVWPEQIATFPSCRKQDLSTLSLCVCT